MNEIPSQLKNPELRFVLLGKWNEWARFEIVDGKNKKVESAIVKPEDYQKYKDSKIWKMLGKAPFEPSWQQNGYAYNNEKLLTHIREGYNVGVIGGYGNLRILDIDNPELAREIATKLDTYTVKTGSGGMHFYFYSHYNKNHVLINNLGELRSQNYQVVSVPSTHPSGNKYEIINPSNIFYLTSERLLEIIKDYLRPEYSSTTYSPTPEKEKDESRSAKEYGIVIKLIKNKKTKEQVFKEMELYSKWASSSIQYRELTYAKALDAVNRELSDKENGLLEISHPAEGKLISEFIVPLAQKLKESKRVFYRVNTKSVVEVGKIKLHKNSEENYNGFIDIRPGRFITLIEKYVTPGVWIYNDKKKETSFRKKSIGSDLANTILMSELLQSELPQIERIFTIPIPLIYEGELTFPKKGYDERFESWLDYDSPEITNLTMSIDEAKKILNDIFKEFCFSSIKDRDLAIAALLTPFLRGLFSSTTVRTPIFCYLANRERCGKDYCAGITGIVYEGIALEESPISNDKTSNTDELRKKILSALIVGRKRLHFSNNKGFIDNSTLEAISTAAKWSDRPLGRNDMLTFDNELDFSLSGNVGVSFTADLANRSRFINFFLDIEDANSRIFEKPNLHEWVKNNRSLILSALYSLIRNWIESGKPPSSTPFTSFSEWAKICGGIMDAAGYANPCSQEDVSSQIGMSIDWETGEMKKLFELCYSRFPDSPITKNDITNILKNEPDLDIFPNLDLSDRSGATKFGLILTKFTGRVLSNIRMQGNLEVRGARRTYFFTKIVEQNTAEDQKRQPFVTLGNILAPLALRGKNSISSIDNARTLPTVANVAKNSTLVTYGNQSEHSSDNSNSKNLTLNSTGGD